MFETTKTKAKVEIKKYVSGREKQVVDSVLYKNSKFSVVNKEMALKDLDGNVLQEYLNEMMKQLVVSVNEQKENILDCVLDLPASDTDEILKQVQEVYSNKDFLVERPK